MGRICLILGVVLIAAVQRISAQDGPAFFDFIENKGQWDQQVQFRGELSTGVFYLHNNGFTVDLYNKEDLNRILDTHGDHGAGQSGKKSKKIDYSKDLSGRVTDNSIGVAPVEKKFRGHAYRVEFLGSNPNATAIPEKPLPSHNNYFIGNDPSRWATEVKIYNVVMYKDIYPGIDVRYYSENGELKYDLIVNPGADPSKIVLNYRGAEKLLVRNNDLIIKTSVGEVKELYPYSYQNDNVKGRKKIECKFLVNGNRVSFDLAPYAKNLPLIIDPTLIFSSFTGSSASEYGFTATPGPDGSLFAGGVVFGAGYPVTPGAYQTSFNGGGNNGTDISIMKFSPNGSQRLYATYLGGSDNDYPHSLYCDPQGNLVILGRTYSANYPGTVQGVSPSGSNSNIVVSKLNNTGSAMIGSLNIGGSANDGVNIKDLQRGANQGSESLVRNYGDDSRSEVILDAASNIYVAAQTQSDNFPMVGNGFQRSKAGRQDGVIMKISPDCRSIIWSSYLGGSGDDGAFVLDINPANQDIYVGGGTTSPDFPGVTGGTIGPSFDAGSAGPNSVDGFVTYIANDGSTIRRSTYIGTNSVDLVYGLKFDRKGIPYIMGTTRGTWAARGTPTPSTFGGSNNSQFVAKLQPDLSAYIYTTTFGSGSRKPNISPVAFLVDRCENLYISGWGGWIQTGNTDPYDHAGVAGLPVTGDAIKSTTDNRDFYFIVIEKNATRQLYGTYFGQTNGYGEHVDGGTSRYDQQGVIYQAICANCYGGARFPTTPGVVGPRNGSTDCNLAALKIAFDFAGVAAGPKSFVNNVPDSSGCLPFEVELRDTIRNAESYIWQFDDGTPDVVTTSPSITHVFNQVRRHRVRLIAIDPNSCNERDSADIYIRVGDDSVQLDMEINKVGDCQSLQYEFINKSGGNRKPFTDTSFVWDFGDGTRIPAGLGSVIHSYAEPGTYMVRLILVDTAYCNSPDSMPYRQGLRVSPLVVAQFETPDKGCVPYQAQFINTSLAGDEFSWYVDGQLFSRDVNPTYLFPTADTYKIKLVAEDENTCNKIDSAEMTITVYNAPTAAFSFTPVNPEVNKPTIFHNHSVGGVRYEWHFGDGEWVVKNNMDTVMHQYNETDTFNVMLITYNAAGCPDTAYQEVSSLIDPLLDIPNAFTPGRFGKNSVIRVEGFGISKMSWKIYNRWGQKVFETNDRRAGWDGTLNGKPLPVDVYTYTLDAQFFDGRTTRKTGDITLIR